MAYNSPTRSILTLKLFEGHQLGSSYWLGLLLRQFCQREILSKLRRRIWEQRDKKDSKKSKVLDKHMIFCSNNTFYKLVMALASPCTWQLCSCVHIQILSCLWLMVVDVVVVVVVDDESRVMFATIETALSLRLKSAKKDALARSQSGTLWLSVFLKDCSTFFFKTINKCYCLMLLIIIRI